MLRRAIVRSIHKAYTSHGQNSLCTQPSSPLTRTLHNPYAVPLIKSCDPGSCLQSHSHSCPTRASSWELESFLIELLAGSIRVPRVAQPLIASTPQLPFDISQISSNRAQRPSMEVHWGVLEIVTCICHGLKRTEVIAGWTDDAFDAALGSSGTTMRLLWTFEPWSQLLCYRLVAPW